MESVGGGAGEGIISGGPLSSTITSSSSSLPTPVLTTGGATSPAAAGTAASSDPRFHLMTSSSSPTPFSFGGTGRTIIMIGRRICLCLVQMKSIADILPPNSLLTAVLQNAKWTALATVAIYFIFIVLWLPFWILSFVVTEWGVYSLAVVTLVLAGRGVIRFIAFPGASTKVTREMEQEFVKYSVKLLVAASQALLDATSTLLSTTNTTPGQQPSMELLPGLWKRVTTYRDRVLGVYLDVLHYLYQQQQHQQSEQQQQQPNRYNDRTKYGNNRLKGDIGHYSTFTPDARQDGRVLMDHLQKVLGLLDELERHAKPTLDAVMAGQVPPPVVLSDQARRVGQQLLGATSDLRHFVLALRPASNNNNNNTRSDEEEGEDFDDNDEEDEDDPSTFARHTGDNNNVDNSTSTFDALKSGFSSILPLLDPPPHNSIFGFDVQRGCMLSRYQGARQLWIRRPAGGMIDVLHFPAPSDQNNDNNTASASTSNPRAVLYCNPNAGLIEVAAGMSLVGGNVVKLTEQQLQQQRNGELNNSWTDFYTSLGIDVYIFNYAGYGRSYGTNFLDRRAMERNNEEPHRCTTTRRMWRIFRSCFLSFQPTPDTLRADGVAVGQYLLNELGVQELIVHGESIGGLAASATARYLSHHPQTSGKVSMLLCDRTFCNLEAVAQRLVGGWSGYAIRALAPLWNTDVTGDFMAASCAKVVASDAADAIIADQASLKTGIALWKELFHQHRRRSSRTTTTTTRGVGWIPDIPLQYRMADWENVCVNDSRYVAGTVLSRSNQSSSSSSSSSRLVHAPKAPIWPNDKHVSLDEAFHFAACCKRIGKFAKRHSKMIRHGNHYEGVQLVPPDSIPDHDLSLHLETTQEQQQQEMQARPPPSSQQLPMQVWFVLASCDGLTGLTLGSAVKRGFDSTVAWLCSALVWGGQTVVAHAEARMQKSLHSQQQQQKQQFGSPPVEVAAQDFDGRPVGYEKQETETMMFPKPIPEVVEKVSAFLEMGDSDVLQLSHELTFVVGMLQYIQARLSSPPIFEQSRRSRHLLPELDGSSGYSTGSFLNLHCGHNSPFSLDEKVQLIAILDQALGHKQQQSSGTTSSPI